MEDGQCNTSVLKSCSQHYQAAVWADELRCDGSDEPHEGKTWRYLCCSRTKALDEEPPAGIHVEDTWVFLTGHLIIRVASWVKTCWRETAPHPLTPSSPHLRYPRPHWIPALEAQSDNHQTRHYTVGLAKANTRECRILTEQLTRLPKRRSRATTASPRVVGSAKASAGFNPPEANAEGKAVSTVAVRYQSRPAWASTHALLISSGKATLHATPIPFPSPATPPPLISLARSLAQLGACQRLAYGPGGLYILYLHNTQRPKSRSSCKARITVPNQRDVPFPRFRVEQLTGSCSNRALQPPPSSSFQGCRAIDDTASHLMYIREGNPVWDTIASVPSLCYCSP